MIQEEKDRLTKLFELLIKIDQKKAKETVSPSSVGSKIQEVKVTV